MCMVELLVDFKFSKKPTNFNLVVLDHKFKDLFV